MYDGQNLAGEYNSAGQLTRRYVFGPGVDAPLVQYEGAVTTAKSWLYANQQGSIVALANVTGATTGSQAYGPFGETAGTPVSRFGYTGQQYLAPLGLYYYKARMYSPTLGRFLQTDPIGTKDDLNLYAYVKNNPVNFTDPTGLLAKTQTGSNFNTNVAAAPATNLNAPAISMPASQMGDATQVAGVKNGDTMGGNGRENEQAKSVAVQLGLSREQRDELHRAITKEGYDYQEVLRIGREIAGKK
jgi:RHS repeat-associated protein